VSELNVIDYRIFLETVHLCTEEAVGFEATPLNFVCRSQRRLLPRTRRPQFNAIPCSSFPSFVSYSLSRRPSNQLCVTCQSSRPHEKHSRCSEQTNRPRDNVTWLQWLRAVVITMKTLSKRRLDKKTLWHCCKHGLFQHNASSNYLADSNSLKIRYRWESCYYLSV